MTMTRNTKKIDWTKDRVLQLIGYWKECECLYNPSHKMYGNKSARDDALERITQQLKISTPQIEVNDVKTKMNYLRSQYCREMHKHQVPSKNGTESDDSYNFWPYWFDSMSFVKSFVKVRTFPAQKRERFDDNYYYLNASTEEVSIDEMPMPIKRSKSSETSPYSTDQPEETPLYLYKPDPDILELFQKQISTVTRSQPTTSTQPIISSQPTISSQHTTTAKPCIISKVDTFLPPTTSSHPTTSNNMNSEYDKTFMSFIKVNLGLVTDISLKDELLDKIAMLLLEYKGKQRKLDSIKE